MVDSWVQLPYHNAVDNYFPDSFTREEIRERKIGKAPCQNRTDLNRLRSGRFTDKLRGLILGRQLITNHKLNQHRNPQNTVNPRQIKLFSFAKLRTLQTNPDKI